MRGGCIEIARICRVPVKNIGDPEVADADGQARPLKEPVNKDRLLSTCSPQQARIGPA